MGKLEKLIELFLRQPPEVKFTDVCYLLEAFDYSEQRSKGSHHTFSHPNGETIVIPKVGGKKVKRVYVKRIIEILELSTFEIGNMQIDNSNDLEIDPEEIEEKYD
jgi:predicted RNA binding protein YcfA (HicA-like mRNA interferase family)